MKIERYIVEIEMPDGDMASSTWVCDTLQSESDVEDEGRWKVSVKEQWKPSEEQMKAIEHICDGNYNVDLDILDSIYRDFKKLREE
ncbi:MAG: hypothetical protein J6S67_11520 [Methanobrevibacter sp.]|nr:hypothetical protein [Methanobrevibacter sp.]